MASIVKNKTNKIKSYLGNGSDEIEHTKEEVKNKYPGDKTRNFYGNTHQNLFLNGAKNNENEEDFQIGTFNSGDGGSEVISVFVKTSRRLQDLVRGYEAKINQTSAFIQCLQQHIYNLHEQLAHKNKMIGRVCDRYVALSKEKQGSEEHLQKKIDELNSVVETCMKNDTPHLQRLLIQQIEKNRRLEYQNEILSQRITQLCRETPLRDEI